MFCHECETTLPFLDIKELLAEPPISVIICTTPESFADVVVEMDDHTLLRKFLCNSIPDLQSRGVFCEFGVLLQDLIEYNRTIGLTE